MPWEVSVELTRPGTNITSSCRLLNHSSGQPDTYQSSPMSFPNDASVEVHVVKTKVSKNCKIWHILPDNSNLTCFYCNLVTANFVVFPLSSDKL